MVKRDKEYYGRDLILASKTGKIDELLQALKLGAKVDVCDKYGGTSLMHACYRGYPEIVNILLERGANTKLKNNEGQTALDAAIDGENSEVLDILSNVLPELRRKKAEASKRTVDSDLQKVLKAYSKKSKIPFLPSGDDAIKKLEKLKLPESILNFYANFEPQEGVFELRLWQVGSILLENSKKWKNLSKQGFVAFASTSGGDPFCYNLKDVDRNEMPSIYLFSHEYSYEGWSFSEVREKGKRVARDLTEFLKLAGNKNLDLTANV
jgi:hypothetical protein